MAGLLGSWDPLASLLGPAQNTDPLAQYVGSDPVAARWDAIGNVAGGLSDALLYRGPRRNSGGIAGAIGQLGAGFGAGGAAAAKAGQERLATDLLKKQALTKMQDEDYARQKEKDQDAAWANFAAGLPPEQRAMIKDNPALAKLLGEQWAQAQYPTGTAAQTPALIQEYEYAKQNGFKGSIVDYQQAKLKPTTENTPSSIQEYEYAKKNGYTGSYQQFLGEKQGAGFEVQTKDGTTVRVGGKGGSGGKDTDAVRRAQLLTAQMAPSVDNLKTTFSTLADPTNFAGRMFENVGGRFIMTPEGQQAADSISGVVAAFGYLRSGQALTAQEIRQGTEELTPYPSDAQSTKDLKWQKLQIMYEAAQAMAKTTIGKSATEGTSVEAPGDEYEWVRDETGKLVKRKVAK